MSILKEDTLKNLDEENQSLSDKTRAIFQKSRERVENMTEEEKRNEVLKGLPEVYTELSKEDSTTKATVYMFAAVNDVVSNSGMMSNTTDNLIPIYHSLRLMFPELIYYFDKVEFSELTRADLLDSEAKKLVNHYYDRMEKNLDSKW